MGFLSEFIDKFIEATDFQVPVTVSEDTVLLDLPEWDSLAALAVIVMFDIEYDKAITGDDLSRVITLKDLFNLTEN